MKPLKRSRANEMNTERESKEKQCRSANWGKAILDDAFTPKDARVAVVGDLISQGGKLRFKVAGTNEVFPVAPAPHASWQKQSGKPLLVNGLISEPANQSDIGTLRITSASNAPPADKKKM
jgi:hypothetical protein